MRPKDFIKDPVFQLNLLIWMSIEQPPEHFRVRPLFYEGGFELLAIEQPFNFPVEAIKRIEAAAKAKKLEISVNPEPDLLLRRTGEAEALYFEAKISSHSSQSTSAKQTRGHLLAAGPMFSEVLNGLTECLLVYVVPQTDQAPMKQCLDNICHELTALGLEPGTGAVDALSVTGDTAHYHLDLSTAQVLGISAGQIPVMEGLDEETDPSPLLLVYSDEDCYNNTNKDFYRRALQNQVLARLVGDLHRAPIKTDYVVSARDLLIRTSSQVFTYVGKKRQASMETLIVNNVFRQIAKGWSKKTPSVVKVQSREAIFNFWDESHKEDFLDWLENAKKTNFPDAKPAASVHTELFPPESVTSKKEISSV